MQETSFGYICFGRVILIRGINVNIALFPNVLQAEYSEFDNLGELLQRFWRIEELHDNENQITTEQEEAEKLFVQTHYRNTHGRYVVNIPLRSNALPIGDTRVIALRRFHQLERKLQRDEQLRERYITFMREYEQLGHMTIATRPPKPGYVVYIPHHAVQKKFRVVFDASCKNADGISFNKMHMDCPKMQLDLHDIIAFSNK